MQQAHLHQLGKGARALTFFQQAGEKYFHTGQIRRQVEPVGEILWTVPQCRKQTAVGNQLTNPVRVNDKKPAVIHFREDSQCMFLKTANHEY